MKNKFITDPEHEVNDKDLDEIKTNHVHAYFKIEGCYCKKCNACPDVMKCQLHKKTNYLQEMMVITETAMNDIIHVSDGIMSESLANSVKNQVGRLRKKMEKEYNLEKKDED